jgi:hypothetical protein
MESPLRLNDTLVQVLCKHRNWLDIRHLKTLAWMMTGLIQSGKISLTAWAPYVHSRAVYAQSTVRRFIRWLNNPRIDVHSLYGPLIQQALAEGALQTVSGAGHIDAVGQVLYDPHLGDLSRASRAPRLESAEAQQQ